METKAPRAPKPPRSSPKATLAVYSSIELIERVDRHAVARGIGRSASAVELLESALGRVEAARDKAPEDHTAALEALGMSQ